jgi:hypothetical protein
MGVGGDALKGAMGGAALGSTVPGVGTLLGGGIGGLLGALGSYWGGSPQNPGQSEIDRMNGLYDQLGNRQPLGPAAQAGYSDFRGDQRGYIDQLNALANGKGPSLATNMLNQATADATNNQYAQAAGARGNASLANRSAANSAAMLQGQSAQAGANARVQEQLGALGMLGGTISGARGQDEGLGMFNAGQKNQMSMTDAQLAQMNNQLRLQSLMGAMGGQMQGSQIASQQPGWGDYLMAFGGGLGQARGFGKPQGQSAQSGQGGLGGYDYFGFGNGGQPNPVGYPSQHA